LLDDVLACVANDSQVIVGQAGVSVVFFHALAQLRQFAAQAGQGARHFRLVWVSGPNLERVRRSSRGVRRATVSLLQARADGSDQRVVVVEHGPFPALAVSQRNVEASPD
jgi:hypothetical protein